MTYILYRTAPSASGTGLDYTVLVRGMVPTFAHEGTHPGRRNPSDGMP